ncbi:MAG: oxidoreductase [Lentisphaerae bacterium GWF2_45_14]|nr:MAG: oxidoreductase [Lentisphaerae bacterium GWF2_45_14]
MKKIRIALAGCGRISQNHFESFKELKGKYELAAVCDIVKDRADSASQKYGGKVFYDYSEMLKYGEFDVVTIATPSGIHPDLGIMAAAAGKHVVTEKPMAVDLKKADDLIDACDKYGVKLFVVKQNRLNATMALLKKAVDKKRFGRIYAMHVNVLWQRPQSYYDLAPWRGTSTLDGGSFMNQASHYVDSLLWLGGDIVEVEAFTATLERKIEMEDTGSAIFKFKSGAIGSMNVTMLTYPKNLEGSVMILGERGTVKVGGTSINHIDHWEFSDYDDDDKLVESSNYQPPNVYGFGHSPYYENVFSVLEGKDKPGTDGREGRKSLELILAIYKSAKEGRSVKLPLDTNNNL